MKFIATKDKLIRVGKLKHVLAQKGQMIDLPEWMGKIHKFSILRKGVEVKHVPEPEVIDNSYEEKLAKVKGMGKKRAIDFIKIFPTEEVLKKAIKDKKHISGRDDVVKRIKKMFSD